LLNHYRFLEVKATMIKPDPTIEGDDVQPG